MGFFQSLKLTNEQFKFLESKHYEGLVFQFIYPKGSIKDSPKLVAYAMKKGHKKISDDAFQNLEYNTNSKPIEITDEHFIGSLQVTKGEIDKLLKDSNQDPQMYDFFLFTPKFDASSKYVIYDVSVVPTTLNQLLVKPIPANPSPPATAFS